MDRNTASGVSGEHFQRWRKRTRDGGLGWESPTAICSVALFPTSCSTQVQPVRMDIDKVGRVHSYVQAQLPFVPFYGTGLFAPVDSLHGAFGPQTPILVARNPHVNIQRELDSLSASTYLEIQGSGRLPAQADFTLAKKSTEVRKDRSMYHPLRADKRKRPLRLKRCIQITPDPGPIAEPAKERTPMKSQRNRRCEKPRLPTTLSFLYGLTPKNIGPSRLTVSYLRASRKPDSTLIISRYRLVIRVFSGKENHPRLQQKPLSWT